jgi:hypothetical protein
LLRLLQTLKKHVNISLCCNLLARRIKLVNATQGYRNKTPKLVAVLETVPNQEGAKEFVVVEKKLTSTNISCLITFS